MGTIFISPAPPAMASAPPQPDAVMIDAKDVDRIVQGEEKDKVGMTISYREVRELLEKRRMLFLAQAIERTPPKVFATMRNDLRVKFLWLMQKRGEFDEDVSYLATNRNITAAMLSAMGQWNRRVIGLISDIDARPEMLGVIRELDGRLIVFCPVVKPWLPMSYLDADSLPEHYYQGEMVGENEVICSICRSKGPVEGHQIGIVRLRQKTRPFYLCTKPECFATWRGRWPEPLPEAPTVQVTDVK